MSSYITIERTEGLTKESEFRSIIIQREYERFLIEKSLNDHDFEAAKKIYNNAFVKAKKLIFDFVKIHLDLDVDINLPNEFYYLYRSEGNSAALIIDRSNLSQFYIAIDPFDLFQYTDDLELIYLQSIKIFLHELLHCVTVQPLYFIEESNTYVLTTGFETQEFRFYYNGEGRSRVWIRSIGMTINEAIVEYLSIYVFTLKKFNGWVSVDFQRDILPKDNEIYGTNVRKFIDLYDKTPFEKNKDYLKTLLMSLLDSYEFEGVFENQDDKGGYLIIDYLNKIFQSDLTRL